MKNLRFYAPEQVNRCLLCADAPCSKACKKMDTARIIRALKFGNDEGAATLLPEDLPCIKCTLKGCEKACVRNKIDKPVEIETIMEYVSTIPLTNKSPLPSLEIEFCGIHCENPFILGSSVISSSYEMCAKALEAGWGGVCTKTITNLDINEVSPRFDATKDDNGNFVGFKNLEQLSQNSFEYDLDWIKRLKQTYPTKLIIVSFMCSNEDDWGKIAKQIEDIGADIIECNFSCPQMVGRNLGCEIGSNEDLVERYTRSVTQNVTIPVLTKLTPNIDSPNRFVEASMRGGATGISAINTIKSLISIPYIDHSGNDIDGKTAISGYSGYAVKPIALRFINETIDALENISDKDVVVSGVGGVKKWNDALDFLLLGARNVQVCTAVMQYGYRIIDDLVNGLQHYMLRNQISALDDLVGKARQNVVSHRFLTRGEIKLPVFDLNKCIGCERCYISCFDGGHQALSIGAARKPILNLSKCTGCHLCLLVCPVGAIS